MSCGHGNGDASHRATASRQHRGQSSFAPLHLSQVCSEPFKVAARRENVPSFQTLETGWLGLGFLSASWKQAGWLGGCSFHDSEPYCTEVIAERYSCCTQTCRGIRAPMYVRSLSIALQPDCQTDVNPMYRLPYMVPRVPTACGLGSSGGLRRPTVVQNIGRIASVACQP